MKLSEHTLKVLKNFSNFNPNIVLREGNTIRTISKSNNVMAQAIVEDEFPSTAGIFDLNHFISTITLLEEPDIEFGEHAFRISSGKQRINYTYSVESVLKTPPEKNIQMGDISIKARIKNDDLAKIRKGSSVMRLPYLSFEGDGEKMQVKAIHGEDPTASTYTIDLEDFDIPEWTFKAVVATEKLQILPGDYEIEIWEKGLMRIVGEDERLIYWIAVEEKMSEFNA